MVPAHTISQRFQRYVAPRLLTGWRAYAVAVTLALTAYVATAIAVPLIGRTIFLFFYTAVILTAWYGGFSAALVAMAISLLGIDYEFVRPVGHFSLVNARDAISLLLFAVVAGTVSWMGDRAARIAIRAGESARALEDALHKLEKTNAELERREAFLEDAQRIANIASWEWDLGSNAMRWSNDVYRFFGGAAPTLRSEHEMPFEASMELIHPDDRQRVRDMLTQATRSRESASFTYRLLGPDGTLRWARATCRAFVDPTGAVKRVMGTVQDITPEHEETERAARLLAITASFARALDASSVAGVITAEVGPALGAAYSSLRLLDEERQMLVRVRSPRAAEPMSGVVDEAPLTGRIPVVEAVRRRLPVFAPSRAVLERTFPEALGSSDALGVRSVISYPLITGERVHGTMTLSFAQDRSIDARERAFLDAIALEASRALERTTLIAAERMATQRAARLQRLAADLSRTETAQDVGDVVLTHVGAAFDTAACAVFELGADDSELLAVSALGFGAQARTAIDRIAADAPLPMRDVLRTREAVFIRNRKEWLSRYSPIPSLFPSATHDSSSAALPLLVRNRCLGVMTVTLRAFSTFPVEQRQFMRAFADQCAQALDRCARPKSITAAV